MIDRLSIYLFQTQPFPDEAYPESDHDAEDEAPQEQKEPPAQVSEEHGKLKAGGEPDSTL